MLIFLERGLSPIAKPFETGSKFGNLGGTYPPKSYSSTHPGVPTNSVYQVLSLSGMKSESVNIQMKAGYPAIAERILVSEVG